MDALLGRHKMSSRIKALAKLAISRITVLKNQRRARSSLARSDVIQLLNLGHHDRALLRTELVIKEQNMFDALSMIEGYCKILAQSNGLLDKNKEVSDHLKEAITSLMFAAPRCGEFPELREIRRIICKEFTVSVDDNNSSVNPKIIRKLTLARQPSYESRLMALKEIASEKGIDLPQLGHSVELNTQEVDQETDSTNEADKPDLALNDGLYESPRDASEDKNGADEAEDELRSVNDAVADSGAAIGLSWSDLENHCDDGDNDVPPDDERLTNNTYIPSEPTSHQGDSLGNNNRRCLARQNGRIVERHHRNILREESNNVISYRGVEVQSDLLNGGNRDVVYQERVFENL